MQKQFVEVYIEWLQEDIQRIQIPEKGVRFCPQIRFEEEGNILPKWTAEIFLKKWDANNHCYADLRYLFDETPHYLLKRGSIFRIYDGPNEVAKGKILDDKKH